MSSKTIKHIDLRRGVESVALPNRPKPLQTDDGSFINTANKPLPRFRFTDDDSITMDNRVGHSQAGLVGLLTEGGDHLVTEDSFNILTE